MIHNSKKLTLLSFILSFSVTFGYNTCPGTCPRETAKKIFIMGETGVGKSTVSNVLTGQSPNLGCWKTGAGGKRVTTNTTDYGCFPLLDGTIVIAESAF